LGKPRGEVLGFTRARAHANGPETTKPCMLSDTSQQQHANFVGLKRLWPLSNRSIFMWGFLKDDILACAETWD
jgi:hypothetical protein